MTKKELEQYRSICAEIEEINAKLAEKAAHVTVRGSDSEFPYTEHIMSVHGITHTNDNIRLISRLRNLKTQKQAIEHYIDSIEDSLTRRIFEYRYIYGAYKPSWQRVAVLVGGGNTADSIRMCHIRQLKKKGNGRA